MSRPFEGEGCLFISQGNTDGQKLTAFGALDAIVVPWIVVPQRFFSDQKGKIKGNAFAIVICDGKMFYAIVGDTKYGYLYLVKSLPN